MGLLNILTLSEGVFFVNKTNIHSRITFIDPSLVPVSRVPARFLVLRARDARSVRLRRRRAAVLFLNILRSGIRPAFPTRRGMPRRYDESWD